MTRAFFIERLLRDIYGGYIPQDSEITPNLVNSYINDAAGLAAKQAYNDTLQIDGIASVNNGFYTNFKGLIISEDEYFSYKVELPQIPVGLGKNEGISTVQIKDANGNLSYTALPLSEAQIGYMQSLVKGPEELWYLPQGKFVYLQTTLLLSVGYTVSVRMISAGDSTDMNSTLNVPDDYIAILEMYITKKLKEQRLLPKDSASDGIDKP